MRSMLATEVHRRLISDCNGRDPRSGAAPPGSGRFSRRDAAVRAVLCWRRLRRFPSRRRPPPGFWVVLQKNGPEFDVIPGFWAVVSVPRRDSRRWLRYNPRSEAFTSSMSRSAAYETAQNCTRALARVANSPSVELPTKPPRTLLGHFADLRTLGIDWFTKPPRTLLGHFGSRIGLSVELPTKPLRTLLGRSAAERWMNIV